MSIQTVCDGCGAVIHETDDRWKIYKWGKSPGDVTLHVCSAACASKAIEASEKGKRRK